ncbi:putative plastidic glucose transporter 1 [Vitis vinifera]|uniref:Putative plastidic glucose transporter 1 n=1 Tax=Vitis vinifera TaxID=29760 RepID=A0A438CJ63_VITVI|nr:putative plastidic glucose transporter 1 [Vitis vinifera]
MLYIATIPGFIISLGMQFAVESPPLAILNEAKTIIRSLWGVSEVDRAIEEFQAVIRNDGSDLDSNWLELLEEPHSRVAFIGGTLFFLQQFAGINGVLYFSSLTFQDVGITSGALASLFVGVTNFAGALCALYLMDRQGRQRLLIGSYLGMRDGGGGDFPCTHIGSFNFIEEGVFSIPRGLKLKFTTIGKAVSMFLIVYAIISPVDEQLGHNLSILGTLMYIFSFAIGAGPVTGLIIPELSGTRTRGKIMGFSFSVHWVCNFVVGLYFLELVEKLGVAPVYASFGGVSLLSAIFAYYFIVETKGRSLEEIEISLNRNFPSRDRVRIPSTEMASLETIDSDAPAVELIVCDASSSDSAANSVGSEEIEPLLAVSEKPKINIFSVSYSRRKPREQVTKSAEDASFTQFILWAWSGSRCSGLLCMALSSTIYCIMEALSDIFSGLACSFIGVLFIFRPILAAQGGLPKAEEANNIYVGGSDHIYAVLVGLVSSISGGISYCLTRAGAKASDQPVITVFAFGMLGSPAAAICTFAFQDFVLPSFYSFFLMVILAVLAFFAEVNFCPTGNLFLDTPDHVPSNNQSSEHVSTELQVFLARGLQLEKTSKATNIQYIEAALSQLWGLGSSKIAPSFGRLVGCFLIFASTCCTMYFGPDKEME